MSCQDLESYWRGLVEAWKGSHVITSRYCDHLPFYRQAQILARNGFPVDRSVLAGWAGQACWWLEALHEDLAKALFASAKLFAEPVGPAKLRHADADAGARNRPGEDRTAVGLCPR